MGARTVKVDISKVKGEGGPKPMDIDVKEEDIQENSEESINKNELTSEPNIFVHCIQYS